MIEVIKWNTDTMVGDEGDGIVVVNRTMKELKSFESATQSMKYF